MADRDRCPCGGVRDIGLRKEKQMREQKKAILAEKKAKDSQIVKYRQKQRIKFVENANCKAWVYIV